MKLRRLGVLVGAMTVGMAPATGWAQTTPAPPGDARAVGADVEDVTSVAETTATADQNGGRATGDALRVGDETVVGTTQTGPGESSDSLVDTSDENSGGGEEELRVAVLPSGARVTQGGSTTTANATAALLRLVLGDLLELQVLQSSSTATHNGSTSTGSASSDAIFLRIGGGGDDGGGGGDDGGGGGGGGGDDIISELIEGGEGGDDLEIVVLHSDASSTGQGESYVLRIDDTRILTNEDGLEEVCSDVSIEDLVRLACVEVSGGAGSLTATVADATVGGDDGGGGGLTAQVVNSSGRGGNAPAAPAAAELPA
ncbi:MAG: hypothetical protein M3Q48_03025, partial [Actinomycetota bacterium]|nr:hypothetical protein [Actinomycetota bacterium]